jgi:serralysin
VKRSVLLLLAVVVGLLLVSGVAIARTINCDGGQCRGTNSSDTMYGSGGRDNIYSLRGADLVRGNGGSDSVNGDGGRDWLSGGRRNDEVNGGDDDDVVAGNSGFDAMNGGNGDDRMEAVDGMEDRISCGNGTHDIVVFDRRIDIIRDRRECEDRRPH